MIAELIKQLTVSRLAFILLLTSTIAYNSKDVLAANTPAKKAFLQTSNTVLESLPGAEKSTQVVKLKSGEIVTHSRQRLTVEAPNATITVAPGAIVIIDATDKLTRVLACWESSRKCTSVSSLGKTSFVPLGGELSIVVETDTDEAEKILSKTNLRRRFVRYDKPKDGIIMVNAQFSLLDSLLKDPLLHTLSQEDNHESKSIINSVNKAAAALTLASSKEPYSLIDQP